MAVQKFRGGIQFRLGEGAARADNFVARIAPRRNQHDHDAAVRQSHIRTCSRTALRSGGDTIIPTPRETSASTCPARSVISAAERAPRQLPVDPIAILNAQSRLRGNFLGEKTIRRGGGHPPGRGVRLKKVSAVLQVRHDVANGRGAQRLFKALGNRAGRDGFSRLNVGAHHVRQNLPVSSFLESRVAHGSTHSRQCYYYSRSYVKPRQSLSRR